MSDARAFSLTVITLLQLCRAEIQNTPPGSWYSANIINDGTEYLPKPISEIFSTPGPSLSTNPIIVLSSPNPTKLDLSSWQPQTTWQSSSMLPQTTWQSSSMPPSSTWQTSNMPPQTTWQTSSMPPPTTWQSSTLPPSLTWQSSTMPPPSTWQSSTMPPPSTWQSSTLPPPTTWQSSTIPPSSPDITVTTYSTTPSPADMKTFTVQKNFPPLESLSQVQPTVFQQPQNQNQTANYIYIYQQAPLNIQNTPNAPPQEPQPIQPQTLPQKTIGTTIQPSTIKPRPTPKVTVTSRGTTKLITANNATTPIPKGVPYIRIRMISPKGTITNVNINPKTTTKRPATTKRRTTTRTPKLRKNNYDDCLKGCKARKEPICASPLSAGTIDLKTLKGFPSICHMACHNSFRKEPYEKIVDGRCGRLRTRIKTVDSKDKLKRDELEKAEYTVIHNGPGQIVEFTPLSRND